MRKLILISAIALFAFAVTGMARAADPSNLVGWWRFEENADDSSGNGNDGTEVGTITYTTGKIGQAISLTGQSGNYIEVPDDDSLDLDRVTIEAWIKIDSGEVGTGQRNIVRKGHFGNRTYGLDTVVSEGKRVLRGWVNVGLTGGAAAKIVTGTTNLADGKWHHVAMTYGGEYVKIFVDGESEGNPVYTTGNIYDNNLSVRIGGQNPGDSGGALAFKGLIDEVRIWNVALDPKEFNDGDLDGVKDDIDKCQVTKRDNWQINGKMIGTAGYLGVNRHMWNGEKFVTLLSKNAKGKTNFYQADSEFTMDYTYGCSCEQILNAVTQTLGFKMEGHYKFGCSKSVIESWHMDWEDGILDGQKYIETVTVDSSSYNPISSSNVLLAGKKYKLVASGTWTNTPYNVADAEYASIDGWESYFDGYNIEPWYLGEGEFDLLVDGQFVYWGEYNPSHVYTLTYIGNGAPVSFLIFDGDSTKNPPERYEDWYSDNDGSLTVDIYLQLW